VGVLAGVLAITSCTGKNEKKADPTASASAGQASGAEQWTVAELSAALFTQAPGAVLGTVTGKLPHNNEDVPMKMEV